MEDHDLFGLPEVKTQCGFCYRILPLVEAVISTIQITPTAKEQKHFCCDECAINWWEVANGRE